MSLVTLVSGGIDSTLMSLMAHEEGIDIYPLFVDYGQLSAFKEWEACKQLYNMYSIGNVKRMDVSGFGKLISSGITNFAMRINEDAFLPGRNLLLLLCGAAYAYEVQASGVAIGLLNPAYSIFPDQTLAFIHKSEDIIAITIGKRIKVVTPLIEYTKADVLIMAEKRGIKGTYSCHSGEDKPCGKCVSCIEIKNAIERR